MSTLAEIFQQYGAAYQNKYGPGMLPSHWRAMTDIARCRTELLGGHLYYCETCEKNHGCYHSCRNRHCPQCQFQAGEQWLARQQALLLPVRHFMVTFTLPKQLRQVARSHQKVIYDLLFKTSAAALQELAADPRFGGGQIGMVGVLHTWKRDLCYHPHVHYLVPGGALSSDGQRWLPCRKAFLVHVKPLSVLFRAKFRDALKEAGLFEEVPTEVWSKKWVVHCKAVGNGQKALKYLAPYIFRVALSNNRIVKVEEGNVTFRYRPNGSRKYIYCTLPAEQFIHRFLQHTLPKGFVKVRYYGLFSSGNRHRLALARRLLGVDSVTSASRQSDPESEPTQSYPCPSCGKPMILLSRIKATSRSPPQPQPDHVLDFQSA